jgi:hypothetical protein
MTVEQNSIKAAFLDGVFQVIALLCEDTDFVPSYGVIHLKRGSINDNNMLLDGLRKYSEYSQISCKAVTEWNSCLKLLLDKWVMKKIPVKHDKLVTYYDRIEYLYQFIFESISDDKDGKDIQSKHICLSGDWWDYDAEGIIIDDGIYCYLIYFMFSD